MTKFNNLSFGKFRCHSENFEYKNIGGKNK